MREPAPGQWFFVLDEPARIIVADDDPIFREFASVHIASPAAEVVTVCDGQEAWERLSAEWFDLALVDLEMPRLDGFGLTERIRSDASLCRLPIVVVTGREDIRSIDRAYSLGATSFVAKPVNWRLLSHQLKYVLRMDKVARQALLDRDYSRRVSALKSELLQALATEASNAFRGFIEAHQTLVSAGSAGPMASHAGVAASKMVEAVNDQFLLRSRDVQMLARSTSFEEQECDVSHVIRLACEASQHPNDVIESLMPAGAAAISVICDCAYVGRLLALTLDSVLPMAGRIQIGFTPGERHSEFFIRAAHVDGSSFNLQIAQRAVRLLDGELICSSDDADCIILIRIPMQRVGRSSRAA